LQGLLQVDPSRRLTADDVLNSDWLKHAALAAVRTNAPQDRAAECTAARADLASEWATSSPQLAASETPTETPTETPARNAAPCTPTLGPDLAPAGLSVSSVAAGDDVPAGMDVEVAAPAASSQSAEADAEAARMEVRLRAVQNAVREVVLCAPRTAQPA
jgi:hypothetical protein